MGKKIFKAVFIFSFILLLSPHLPAEENFTINFNNVDIRIFLKFMSEQLNKNFIIDNNVKGNVTIISPQKIPSSEAERVFLAVLDVYGYAAIPRGDMTAIIPVVGIKEKGLEVIVGKEPIIIEKLGERYIIQLIPLTYCSARDLVTLLSPFVEKVGNLSADERTNTLIITAPASSISRLTKMVTALDVESPPGQETLHIYKLENADSEEIAKVLTAVATARVTQQRVIAPKGAPATAIVPSAIVADKASNSLIITASPEEYSALRKIIEELDILQNQVFIEALIAEVSESLMSEMGIKWEDETIRQNLFGLAIGSITDVSNLPTSIGTLINFYKSNTDFHILSTPQIQCVNNQEATITVAQNIPYLKESRISEDETVVNTYDYKDVGVVLKILPQISSESKSVRLKISQEVTEVVGDLTTTPVTAKRTAGTTIIVADRQTIIIGGLIKETRNQVIHKIPLLGDIPLLGLIFRRKSFQKERTNLLILITPYVVSSSQDAEKIKKEKEKILKGKINLPLPPLQNK